MQLTDLVLQHCFGSVMLLFIIYILFLGEVMTLNGEILGLGSEILVLKLKWKKNVFPLH